MLTRTFRLASIVVFSAFLGNIAYAQPYSEQDLWWILKCSYGVDPLAQKDQSKPFEKGKSLVFPPITLDHKAERLGLELAPLLKTYWECKANFFIFPIRLGHQWMALRLTKDDAFLVPEVLDSSEKPREALANKMWLNIEPLLPRWPKSEPLKVVNNLVQPDTASSGAILVYNLMNQNEPYPRRLTVEEVAAIREQQELFLAERDKAPEKTGLKKMLSVLKIMK